jgi:MOSC domain-containing protein YiiM
MRDHDTRDRRGCPTGCFAAAEDSKCGIYAEVTAGGTIGVGEAVATEAPKLL